MTTTGPEGALTAEDHLRNAKACETMAEERYQAGDEVTARLYAFLKLKHEGMAKRLEEME